MSPVLGWQPGLDVEVIRLSDGHHEWRMYRRADLLAHGIARNRFTLSLSVWFAFWRYRP